MSRYGYTKGEKEINAILAHQDDQIKGISFPTATEANKRIESSEVLLSSLGYELPKRGEASHRKGHSSPIPTWGQMLKDALRADKGDARLEELFTEEELGKNAEAVTALNEGM